ncbi:MAG: hypothetical protein OWQ57_05520 [Sulfobacillus sp.]|nr:hypothetical protein [Sulfobacillus sp.]
MKIRIEPGPSGHALERFLTTPTVQSLTGEDRVLWELITKFVRGTGLLAFQDDGLLPTDSAIL